MIRNNKGVVKDIKPPYRMIILNVGPLAYDIDISNEILGQAKSMEIIGTIHAEDIGITVYSTR